MGKINKSEIVKRYIYEEDKAGRIKNGQRLPSCRELSKKLSINKITVNRAYRELEEEHRVYSIPRGGFYFVGIDENTDHSQSNTDFKTVKPYDKLIPYREFTHVINKAVDMYKNNLFEYEAARGLESLRNTLKYEFEKDGVYTGKDRIVVTNGAQQAINLVLQYIFENNDRKLLVEAPTYGLVIEITKHLGIDVIGIERREDGFDFKKMEELFNTGEVYAFYVVPRHHNPTGYTLKEKDKQKIAELANRYNVIVIEDDYLADLGSKKGNMPIHYYDISKKTVYIRSFSKTFMPGIRIGAAVLPDFLVEGVASIKYLNDLNTSKLPQAALDLFIKSGMYEKHIKKVRKSYENKLKRAKEIFLSLEIDGLKWHVPECGIFIWVQLPKYIEAVKLEKILEKQGVLIRTALEFFPRKWIKDDNSHVPENCVRLCISGVCEEKIDNLSIFLSAINSLARGQR